MKKQLLTFILICFTSMLAYSQTVDAGLYPGICPGESLTLTGSVSGADPDGYCAKWIAPDGTITYGLTITVAPTTTAVYTFEALFNDGNLDYDEALISVCEMEIHPVNSDFNSSNRGKVLIQTDVTDSDYWTTTRTTKENKPAQSEDGLVKITVHMTPASDNVGKVIYFRLINPDLDDASSYETDVATGDNRDPMNPVGKLNGNTTGDIFDVTELKTINGVEVAAAEVELEITNRYSGDNYQVEASLDPHFDDPAQILQTSELVAWKRMYMEQDNMYLSGATIASSFTPDANSANDVIGVDNTDDFIIGSDVELFNPAGDTEVHTVIAKTATTLTLDDIGMPLSVFDGVRIVGVPTTYEIPLNHFPDAFGASASGADGGAFVEFEWGFNGSGSIPKFTELPSDIITQFFCEHWFKNSGDGTNIFQFVAAASHGTANKLGVTGHGANFSVVFVARHASFTVNMFDAISNTGVHEVGHQFEVANSHVDLQVNEPNHETPSLDFCVMSYNSNPEDGDCEFDTDCLYDIRDATVPR